MQCFVKNIPLKIRFIFDKYCMRACLLVHVAFVSIPMRGDGMELEEDVEGARERESV